MKQKPDETIRAGSYCRVKDESSCLLLFTWAALQCVHIHVWIELSGSQRLTARHVASDPFRRGAIGAHRSARRQAVLCLWLLLLQHLPAVLFLALGSSDVVDSKQEAVVHDLQLHQELRERLG